MIPTTLFDEVLRTFPFLRELPSELQGLLRDSAVPLHFPAGMVAFEEGSECAAFPLLTRGLIRVAKPAPNGREIALYQVGPGDTCVLNLNCLLEGSRLAARGTAAQDCEGISIPQNLFFRLLHDALEFRLWVFRSLSGRVLELMELISEVAFHRLDQRLARLLLAEYDKTGDEIIRKTHQEFASDLGSVREIVSRILGGLAEEGLVRLERGQVQVLDPVGLRERTRGL